MRSHSYFVLERSIGILAVQAKIRTYIEHHELYCDTNDLIRKREKYSQDLYTRRNGIRQKGQRVLPKTKDTNDKSTNFAFVTWENKFIVEVCEMYVPT